MSTEPARQLPSEWPPDGLEALGRCPVCADERRELRHAGLRDALFGAPGAWNLWQCGGCGLLYLDPRPAEAAVALAYSSYYTHEERTDDDPMAAAPGLPATLVGAVLRSYIRLRHGAEARPLRNALAVGMWLRPRTRTAVDAAMRHLPRPFGARQLLDVGCGNGRFMAWARTAGWQCCGTEVDRSSAGLARARGFEVHLGSLGELVRQGRRFDVITLSHVVEHVHEPRELLREVARLLAPGGLLWIETPNSGALGHRVFGRDWRGLEPPRHLQLFHPALLARLLLEAGLAEPVFAPWQADWDVTAPASEDIASRSAAKVPAAPAHARTAGRANPFEREFITVFSAHRPPSAAAQPRVLAVVVTYNPDETLAGHLAALRAQCEVMVVDNASMEQARVQQVCAVAGARFVANSANLGIAAALNQAADAARDEGYDWLACFDQDSLCPPGGIQALLDLHAGHAHAARIGVLAFAHADRGTGADYHHSWDVIAVHPRWKLLRSTITSGSLVRLDLLREEGGFDERLFIDSVDHEFCLRARQRGWLIVEASELVMPHSIGNATVHRLLGRTVTCTHHSAQRRYYMTRNQLEVSRQYLGLDPRWALKGVLQVGSGLLAVLLFESDRPAKFKAAAQGAWHFLRRRFGPRPPSARRPA